MGIWPVCGSVVATPVGAFTVLFTDALVVNRGHVRQQRLLVGVVCGHKGLVDNLLRGAGEQGEVCSVWEEHTLPAPRLEGLAKLCCRFCW